MSNHNKFGATSWEEIETERPKKRENFKDTYLKLEAGDNVVRVLTKPYEYLQHTLKFSPNDPGFGHRIMSSLFHGSDPLTEPPYNSKPKRRWYIGVIDRRTQSYKILDMSISVLRGIQELVKDSDDWGPPGGYDINIKVNKNADPASYYTIIPKSKKPLSPADLEIKQNVDLEVLQKMVTPPTPEQVTERLNVLLQRRNQANGTQTGSVSNTAPSNSKVDDADDDFDFPPANVG
jgi:hypothetical protein